MAVCLLPVVVVCLLPVTLLCVYFRLGERDQELVVCGAGRKELRDQGALLVTSAAHDCQPQHQRLHQTQPHCHMEVCACAAANVKKIMEHVQKYFLLQSLDLKFFESTWKNGTVHAHDFSTFVTLDNVDKPTTI